MPRNTLDNTPDDGYPIEIAYRPPLDEVAGIAVRNRVDDLPALERDVLALHFGVGCRPLDVDEIAERLDEDVRQIEKALDRGLQELGFRVITELAA